MRKIGINLNAYPGGDDEAQIRLAAAQGFTGAHCMACEPARLERIAAACQKNGMVLENLHAPFKGINNMWLEGEAGDAMLAELREAVDRCTLVGAGIAVVHLSSGEDAPPVTDIGRKRFDVLIGYAYKKRVKLAFENQRKLSNIAWVFENYTSEDGVGFCWDCGHENCCTKGREYMPLFGDRLLCVHLHDNLGGKDEDLHYLPFDGTLDFERVAAHLNRAGYTGTLMLEVIAANSDRYDGLSMEEYYARAGSAAEKLKELTEYRRD